MVIIIVNCLNITFDAGKGTASAVTAQTGNNGKLTSLPTASRSGYRFNGWYTAKIGGTAITNNTVFTADTTVYAHWTKKTTTGSSGSGSAPAKTPVQSVDTGDMGIALYAGMALLSLTGGAWVVNKKRKGK